MKVMGLNPENLFYFTDDKQYGYLLLDYHHQCPSHLQPSYNYHPPKKK
jgi:hypothetical protein